MTTKKKLTDLPVKTEWVSFDYFGRVSNRVTSTMLLSEVTDRTRGVCRNATDEEIKSESDHRDYKQLQRNEQSAFMARPEYTDAKAISNLLEWATNEILNKLSSEEWNALRLRLES